MPTFGKWKSEQRWLLSDHCEGEALAFLEGSGGMLPRKILKIETVKYAFLAFFLIFLHNIARRKPKNRQLFLRWEEKGRKKMYVQVDYERHANVGLRWLRPILAHYIQLNHLFGTGKACSLLCRRPKKEKETRFRFQLGMWPRTTTYLLSSLPSQSPCIIVLASSEPELMCLGSIATMSTMTPPPTPQ